MAESATSLNAVVVENLLAVAQQQKLEAADSLPSLTSGSSSPQSRREEQPRFRQLSKNVDSDAIQSVEEMKLNSETGKLSMYSPKPASLATTDYEIRVAEDLHCRRNSTVWRVHLEGILFRRSKEEATMVRCYETMLSEHETSTLLLVKGPVGAGKSWLVKNAFQQRVKDQGGYFLRGKFDQLRRPEPYRGFVSAFNDFTNQVIERGPEAVDAMRLAIYKAIGDECCVLISMIPALERILGDRKDRSNESKIDDGIQRFVFVFRMFMRAISTLEQPMVLLLDGLHWADDCSLDIMSSILKDLKNNNGLIVVGTYDDSDVMVSNSYLSRKLRELEISDGVAITSVSIHNLEHGEVNNLIGNALKLSRLDKTEELGSIVSGQTKGNLFYIIEFIRWLQDSGMLMFNSDAGSWIWDADEIRMTIDLCQVGDFLNDKLEQLPVEMRDVLKVAACFGSNIEETLIEYVLDRPVGSILDEAVANGILVIDGAPGKYAFEHDGLQKAAYSLIPESNRELFHLEVGRRLWRRLNKEELDRNIFVLLSQINIGKSLITREKERYTIASLCLHAGRKAAKSSTFRTATVYLNLAIDLLGDRGWRDEYELTLAVHNAAAEMDMCTANFEAMDKLIESVLIHARCQGDKIQARATQIYAMGVSDRQQEALDLGLAVLASLGERFPRNLCRSKMVSELKSVQKLLKGKSDEQLMRLPHIENGEILACLQILNLMFLQALQVRPYLSPFVTLKLMKLTLTHGLSMIAPLAFSTYGMLCISGMRDVNAAFRFGELGLELLERLEVREYLPRVYAAFYGCIHHWKRPLRDALEPLLHAHRVGMLTGDVEFSSLNAKIYCFTAIDAGVTLGLIKKEWVSFQETMISHRQKSMLRMTYPCVQTVLSCMGTSGSDPLSSKGDLVDTDELLQFCIKNKLHNSANGIRLSHMRTAYLFNDYELADSLARVAIKDIWTMPPSFEIVSSSFMGAMVALAMAAKGKHVRQNIRRATKTLKTMKSFARNCPENCLDKMFLLDAELASVCGKDAKAFEKYMCAIALAKENRFLLIEALANERTARFFVSRGKLVDAAPFFHRACSVYEVWGGHAKADRLRAEVDTLDNQLTLEYHAASAVG